MHVKIEKAAAWSTLGMLVVFGVAFWGVARLLPPISPGLTVDQTAHYYSEHGLRIRIGLGVLVAGMWFMTPPDCASECSCILPSRSVK